MDCLKVTVIAVLLSFLNHSVAGMYLIVWLFTFVLSSWPLNASVSVTHICWCIYMYVRTRTFWKLWGRVISHSSGLKIGRDLFGGCVVWRLSERNWSPLEPWHSLSLQDVCFYYITLDVIVHEDINRLLISSLRPSSNVELFMRWTYANDQNPLHVRAHLL